MFSFNSTKFDFWEIYNCIKHYYPLGIKNDETGFFYSFPGFDEFKKLVYNKIVHAEFEKWQHFEAEVALNTNKRIEGTTYGQAPCYSSYIEIDRFSHENHTRTKELHFFVSFLGPFYTIIGKDNNTVTVDWMTFTNPTYLTVSPENEYAGDFILLESLIESRFPDYRFVPYEIYHQTLDGLTIHYNQGDYNTIFNAIFNTQFNFGIQKIGDEFYKYDSWLKNE